MYLRSNQTNRILMHLVHNGPITPIEALDIHGVYRLSAVILNLRKAGHRIDTELVPSENGGKYAKYRLVG